jgi:excisionase family DNA binding protein
MLVPITSNVAFWTLSPHLTHSGKCWFPSGCLTNERRQFAIDVHAIGVSNSPIGKRLLNVEETAQYLGLDVDTIYRKARLREVPSVKVGRSLRFDIEALNRFIELHTIETID